MARGEVMIIDLSKSDQNRIIQALKYKLAIDQVLRPKAPNRQLKALIERFEGGDN